MRQNDPETLWKFSVVCQQAKTLASTEQGRALAVLDFADVQKTVTGRLSEALRGRWRTKYAKLAIESPDEVVRFSSFCDFIAKIASESSLDGVKYDDDAPLKNKNSRQSKEAGFNTGKSQTTVEVPSVDSRTTNSNGPLVGGKQTNGKLANDREVRDKGNSYTPNFGSNEYGGPTNPRKCYNCNQLGHIKPDCPNLNIDQDRKIYTQHENWTPQNRRSCYRCNSTTHYADACPEKITIEDASGQNPANCQTNESLYPNVRSFCSIAKKKSDKPNEEMRNTRAGSPSKNDEPIQFPISHTCFRCSKTGHFALDCTNQPDRHVYRSLRNKRRQINAKDVVSWGGGHSDGPSPSN